MFDLDDKISSLTDLSFEIVVQNVQLYPSLQKLPASFANELFQRAIIKKGFSTNLLRLFISQGIQLTKLNIWRIHDDEKGPLVSLSILCKFDCLKHLDLQGCLLNGNEFKELLKFNRSLSVLRLNNCEKASAQSANLGDEVAKVFLEFKKLTTLEIEGWTYSSEYVKQLGQLKKLISLNLSKCNCKLYAENLKIFSSLKKFHFNWPKMKPSELSKGLLSLVNLVELSIDGVNMRSKHLVSIFNSCKELKRFSNSHNKKLDNFEAFSKSNLVDLTLQHTSLIPETSFLLPVTLRRLDVSHSILQRIGLSTILSQCENIEVFVITGTAVTTEAINSLQEMYQTRNVEIVFDYDQD